MDVKRNEVFLRHIIDEIEFLTTKTSGLELQDLMKDSILQRACVRSLEIIGEAVKNLSEDSRIKHSGIEWRGYAGLRDKLIHHYFGIDWDIVWDVTKNKLPGLKKEILQLIEEEQGD